MSLTNEHDRRITPPVSPDAVPDGATEVDEIAEPCTRFQGRLSKIMEAVDGLDVTVEGRPIGAPHWVAEIASNFIADEGSTHPMCIATAMGSNAALIVKVEVIAADGLSGEAELVGTIGAGATWRGTFPVAVGVHEITVELDAETTVLRAYQGDIVWRAAVPGCGDKAMGRSHVELYRIARDAPHPFLCKGTLGIAVTG